MTPHTFIKLIKLSILHLEKKINKEISFLEELSGK